MFEQWLFILGKVVAVFGVIGVGAVLRKLNWLTAEADRSLLNLVVRVLLPAYILHVVTREPAVQDTRNLVWPPLAAVVAVLLGFAVALLTARLMGDKLGLTEHRTRRTFALCVGIYNYGYIPLPLAQSMFGLATVGVLLVHGVVVELMIWTVGVALLAGSIGKGSLRKLVNAPMVALVCAIALNFAGAPAYTPDWIDTALMLLGNAAIPMGMVLIGATIMDELQPGAIRSGLKVVAVACALRLAILPVLILLFMKTIPASVELKQVMVLEAAMPAAVFPVVVAKHYGGDAATAVRVVVGTSLASLITIPIWILLGMWFLNLSP